MAATATPRQVIVVGMVSAVRLWERLYTDGWQASLHTTGATPNAFVIETDATSVAVGVTADAVGVTLGW